jgi:hypothetical protein
MLVRLVVKQSQRRPKVATDGEWYVQTSVWVYVGVAFSEYVETRPVNQIIRTQKKSVAARRVCSVSRDGFSYLTRIPSVVDLQLMDREIKEGAEDSYHDPRAEWGDYGEEHPSRRV